MTIAELHANEELRRHEFPVMAERAFFAHAGDCPLPRRVVDSMTEYAMLTATTGQEAAFPGARVQQVRQTAARFLNAQMDEIAFVGPTSLGLNLVACGRPSSSSPTCARMRVLPSMAVELRVLRTRASFCSAGLDSSPATRP